MSKPISFGFAAKSKPEKFTAGRQTSNANHPKISSGLTSTIGNSKRPKSQPARSTKPLLREDSDHEDEVIPKHELLVGFGETGAILSGPQEKQSERVIQIQDDSDWRRRGKNLLPAEIQAAQRGDSTITTEKIEVDKTYGLQFADDETSGSIENTRSLDTLVPLKVLTEDEHAYAALVSDGLSRSKSTTKIDVRSNQNWRDRLEIDDFRADYASRPESSTIDEYDEMPVEEFGLALLRGMGRKRRANGEIIDLQKNTEDEEKSRRERPTQQGFLGIGAKPVKNMEGSELGAWGKNEMRKNARGEGFFTPTMIENKRTGERMTEEEFEKQKSLSRKQDDSESYVKNQKLTEHRGETLRSHSDNEDGRSSKVTSRRDFYDTSQGGIKHIYDRGRQERDVSSKRFEKSSSSRRNGSRSETNDDYNDGITNKDKKRDGYRDSPGRRDRDKSTRDSYSSDHRRDRSYKQSNRNKHYD